MNSVIAIIFALQFLLHLSLLGLRLRFIGFRRKWFGGLGSGGGSDLNSKFAAHAITIICSLPIFLNLRLPRLRLRFPGLRGKWFWWLKGVWM